MQPQEVWDQLRRDGEALVRWSGRVAELPLAYRFLLRNLHRVIPSYSGRLPWWFYTRRPDLKRYSRRYPEGSRHVCIEVEVAAERAFLMPLWAWALVYTGRYLALSRTEFARWERALRGAAVDEDRWPLPRPWRARLEASHLRLFDRSLPARPWEGYAKALLFTPPGREAVVERLRLRDVRKVVQFQGRSTDPVRRKVYEAGRKLREGDRPHQFPKPRAPKRTPRA